MYLYSRTTSDDFVDAFLRSELRREQFSLPALRALHERLSNLAEDIGEPIEFDMIAICCDWVEHTAEEPEADLLANDILDIIRVSHTNEPPTFLVRKNPRLN